MSTYYMNNVLNVYNGSNFDIFIDHYGKIVGDKNMLTIIFQNSSNILEAQKKVYSLAMTTLDDEEKRNKNKANEIMEFAHIEKRMLEALRNIHTTYDRRQHTIKMMSRKANEIIIFLKGRSNRFNRLNQLAAASAASAWEPATRDAARAAEAAEALEVALAAMPARASRLPPPPSRASRASWAEAKASEELEEILARIEALEVAEAAEAAEAEEEPAAADDIVSHEIALRAEAEAAKRFKEDEHLARALQELEEDYSIGGGKSRKQKSRKQKSRKQKSRKQKYRK